jgi:PTS system nitrogen regulatory IIA component
VGPKEATGEHLRVLARISRVLRDEGTRQALARAPSAADAWKVLETREQQLG